MTRRPPPTYAALAFLALAVAGCGGSGGGDAASPATTPAPAAQAGAPAPAATLIPPEPVAPSSTAPTGDSIDLTATTGPVVVPSTVPLPTPSPAPLDDTAPEPVVELGRIAIPAIGLDATLHEGIRLPTFDRGPGHWPGTAMPGQAGNMVVGGHRTSGHADFRGLDRLKPGDEMTVTDSTGAAHRYTVASTEIIDPFAAKVVYQTPQRTATLFACHPPGSVAQRIVVHLRAVP